MVTLNGFLSQQIGEPPRLTAGQKRLVVRALEAVGVSGHVPELQSVPDDRSCLSCDFLHPGTTRCRKWSADVPDRASLNAGCPAWQDHGAPF